MKTRITITLDPQVVQHGKRIARSSERSLSGLIEDLLREHGSSSFHRERGSFSKRWLGRLSARVDAADELLQAMKAKHGLAGK